MSAKRDGHQVFLDKNKEDDKYESNESSGSCGKCQEKSDIWEGFSILKQGGSSVNSGKRCISLLESSGSDAVSNADPDHDGARRALIMLIITSGQSLSLVEESAFQHFMRVLNPLIPVSCPSLDQDIMDLYGRERNILCSIISEAAGAVSFAVDKWKSIETGDNYNDDIYLCVTACFLDSYWKLQRRIVGFKHMEVPNDVIYVSEAIALCINEIQVDKVISITLDNDTVANKFYEASMADSLKTTLHDKCKLLHCGELFQVQCCTDILNSVVQAGLELIADTIDKIRHGIRYITYSYVRKEAFHQSAKEIYHLDVTVKLRADLVVTWDSTYKMLGCALYYREALSHFASTDETFLSHFHLSDDEWNKVAIMEKFLKSLYDVTCIFLNTKIKTANLYFLGVYKVYRLLEMTKECDNFMSAMVKDVKAKFDKYWLECSLILACATVLDPRYKLNLISYCFRKLYGEADARQHIDKVITLLHSLFTVYENSSLSVVGSNVVEYHAKDYLFDDYNPQEQRSELDWYLESPTMDLHTDLDILEFWSGMSKCYPNLANMARDILAIPISTVASKSAFNTRGKILNRRCGTLRPELLEMLISLHDWTCPKDRNGIAVSAVEEYYTDDDEEDEDDLFASDDQNDESMFEPDDYTEENDESTEESDNNE
ncbi:unnamed protein product [Urochloa humidicola]